MAETATTPREISAHLAVLLSIHAALENPCHDRLKSFVRFLSNLPLLRVLVDALLEDGERVLVCSLEIQLEPCAERIVHRVVKLAQVEVNLRMAGRLVYPIKNVLLWRYVKEERCRTREIIQLRGQRTACTVRMAP